MRIGIDARYLSHGIIGGVHAYVNYLTYALIAAAPDSQFFLYADTKSPFEIETIPDHVTLRLLPYQNRLSSIYNDLVRLQQVMQTDNLDVAHFPANYGFGPANARTVITLHDHVNVLPLREIIRGHRDKPRAIPMMTYLHLCSRRTVPRADMIVTMSNYSKDQILRFIDIDPQKMRVWTHSPSPNLHEIKGEATLSKVRQRYKITKPFVIADAIKNPRVLVEAWKLLPPDLRDVWQIVFFSRTPNPPQPVLEAIEAGYAQLHVRPPDDDLRVLYSLAHVLAFPSWYEGLGLPLLEAMICGTVVVASNRGSIPEVAGNAALMCDVNDIDTFSHNLATVMSDSDEHERLKQLGYQRAAEFSWDKTAQAYLEFYRQVRQLPD